MTPVEFKMLLVLRIVSILCAINHLALDITDAVTIGAPHFEAGIGGIDIGRHTATYIALRMHLEDDLTCTGIAEVGAIEAVLVAIPHLQFGRRGVESHQMECIAVAHTCVIKSAAIMVYCHGAIGYLVAAIAIYISHTQVVVTLSGIACPLGVIGIEHPVLLQFTSIPIPSSQNGAGVIAATEDGRSMDAIEIAYTGQHAVGTVSIVVAPVAQVAALGDIGLRIHSLTGKTIKHGDIFIAREYAARHGATWLVILAPLALG